jgi:hypothetical protein
LDISTQTNKGGRNGKIILVETENISLVEDPQNIAERQKTKINAAEKA